MQSMGFPLAFGVRVRDGSASGLCSKSETQSQQKKSARRWLMESYSLKNRARSGKNKKAPKTQKRARKKTARAGVELLKLKLLGPSALSSKISMYNSHSSTTKRKYL